MLRICLISESEIKGDAAAYIEKKVNAFWEGLRARHKLVSRPHSCVLGKFMYFTFVVAD